MIFHKSNVNKTSIKPHLSNFQRDSIISGVGIALEYYSVFLFGYLAFLILPEFFSGSSSLTAKWLLILEAVIGVLGAVVCGHVGDTLGRKRILVYTVAFVALPSFFISILPGYDQIGIIASIIFIFLRLMQMLAFGGDLVGLVTFVLEDVPAKRRGQFGGYMSMSAGIGVCVACLVLYLIDPFSNPSSFWKWRLLLIFGVFGIFIANYLKHTFGETEVFRDYKKRIYKAKIPIIDVFRNNKLVFLRIIGITILAPLITLVVFAWIPQFSVKHLSITPRYSMLLNAGVLFLFVVGAKWFGYWSDKIGRKSILLGVASFFLFCGYPLFKYLGQTETVLQFFVIQMILAFAASAYYGVALTACIEHVPTHIRYSGTALGYYFNLAFFGGISGDHIEKILIENMPMEYSAVFYLLPGAFVVLITSLFLKEEAGHVLSDKHN